MHIYNNINIILNQPVMKTVLVWVLALDQEKMVVALTLTAVDLVLTLAWTTLHPMKNIHVVSY